MILRVSHHLLNENNCYYKYEYEITQLPFMHATKEHKTGGLLSFKHWNILKIFFFTTLSARSEILH